MNIIHNDDYTAQCRDTLSQLFLVTTLMSADMQRGLLERGLTLTRAQVLWFLGEAGRLTQRELAEELKVTPRNVTTLIDALEETGFVRRTAHPTDRRAAVIVLTPKGQESFAKLQSETTEFAKLLFGNVSEGDLKTFRRILDDVSTKLTELAKKGGDR
ncbi:MarR family transcriptional regulator [Pararhizobium sp. BT-229]|uniref:MarR family winged helix-turn-helix transcriptional regulator n=1 Tax=Pararhizobium sp. BT-229 TaxID=2986923 RepID=UPI0021F77F9F|nr:MarR family transcriptional regulator [Pararhizobium sp. BT-229]MCV9966704.1 MarR family transcriptional regulator [Pararhizobium sp. BT-229]